MKARQPLKAQEQEQLLRSLKSRFDMHPARHPGQAWAKVLDRLEGNAAALASLRDMESSGGEPDVIGYDESSGQYIFCDCAAESPAGRPGAGCRADLPRWRWRGRSCAAAR